MTRASAVSRARRTPPQPAWYDEASCRGKSRLFYPPPSENSTQRAAREARAAIVCATCVARVECRTWAREQREFGFWGGESEAARTAAGFVPRSVAELRVQPRLTRDQGSSDRRIRTMVP